MALSPDFERQLDQIVRDRVHGASWLAQRGVAALIQLCQALPAQGGAASLAIVQAAAEHLARARPAMAPLANRAHAFLHHLRAALSETPAALTLQQAALRAQEQLQHEQTQRTRHQLEAASELLKPFRCLMTLSHSHTVERILLQAAPHVKVFVLESRPLLEGRTLALALDRQGRAVRVITEAQMRLFLIEADAVLIGADTVCVDRAVVNKVGSHTLCSLAKRQGLPVFVAADGDKCNPRFTGADVPLEVQPAEDVWPEFPQLCHNAAFETTPVGLINRFITDRGVLSAAQMEEVMAQAQRALAGENRRPAGYDQGAERGGS